VVPSYGRINISLTPILEKQIAGIHVAYEFSKDPYQHAEVEELILLHLEDVCVLYLCAFSENWISRGVYFIPYLHLSRDGI
jgi:hypothetical protein